MAYEVKFEFKRYNNLHILAGRRQVSHPNGTILSGVLSLYKVM
jgi:hypothetical protein